MAKTNVNGDATAGDTLLQKDEASVELQARIAGDSPRNGEPYALVNELPILETLAERRTRKYSHYVIYCTTFIMSIGFSIILTGVWPYLKQLDPTASKEYLGWVIAANPIGQMVFSPILGWWANKMGSTRVAFVVTILLSIVGSGMYALLPLMPTSSGYLIFISRFIVGLSGANIAICRSYIVASTKLKERTSALAAVAASQAIGFILGPIMQSAIAYAFQGDIMNHQPTAEDNDIVLLVNGIPWNMYSVVGYVCVFLSSINLVLYAPCVFKYTPITTGSPRADVDDKQNEVKPDFVAIFVLLFSFFIVGFLFVLLESILVPLTLDMYAYDYKTAVFLVGIGLSVLGLSALFIFIIVAVVAKRLNNDKFLYLIFGFMPMTLGMLLHMPIGGNYPAIMDCGEQGTSNVTSHYTSDSLFFQNMTTGNDTCNSLGCPYFQEWCYNTPIIEKPQLIIAQLVTLAGYAVSFSLAPPLFSKMLGPRPQGVWMGLMTTIGGSARIVGPLFAVYVYAELGPQWLFGMLFVVFILTNMIIGCFYRRLVPFEDRIGQQ